MEDSGYEEAPSGPAAILDAVKKFGIGKLVLIVIILAAAAWFFVLAPKPANLTLTFVALDSPEKIEGVTVDLEYGGKPHSDLSDSSGRVTFKDVPSQTKLTPDVQPPSGYVVSGDVPEITLKSGEPASETINLARAVNLKVEAPVDSLSLGTECKTTLPVTVTNAGEAAQPVQLLGDGALKGLLESESKTVGAKSSATFDVAITAPVKKGTATGRIRVQYTDSSDSFTLEATEPEQLRVGPASFSDRVEPNEAIKKQFTIENTGRSAEARDIKAELTGDFAQIGAQVAFSDELPLKPKEKKILTLELNAPSNPGQSVGVLIISSACQRIQVPLQLNVEAPRN